MNVTAVVAEYAAGILDLIRRRVLHGQARYGLMADRPDLIDRMWVRLRSLFVPSVSAEAILRAINASSPDDAIEQLYSWERDRLLTLAKGASAAAITVLTGLIASAAEGKVTTEPIILYLSGALVAVLLLWGAFILTGLRRLAEEYALALSIVNK